MFERTYIQSSLFLILAVSVMFTAPHFFDLARTAFGQSEQETQEIDAVDVFQRVEIEAKAAYVYNVSSGEVLFEKNARAQLPLASITKVMTALVSGQEGESTFVHIPAEAIFQEGDSGLLAGERWEASDLRDFTLMSSSNDGAYALALAAGASGVHGFVDAMNRKAGELGLEQTFFTNPNGLDEQENILSGSYGSAKDVAHLFAHIVTSRPALLEATTQKEDTFTTSEKMHTAENTNEVIDAIPVALASKTGFTDLAGGNLAVAFEAGPARPIVVVVLGSSREGRFEDVKELVNAAVEHIGQ